MVVSFNAIDMMHNFFSGEVPSKMLFHHKAMFKNISLPIGEWVRRVKNKNISTAIFILPSFPIRMFFFFTPFKSIFWFRMSFFESTAKINMFSFVPSLLSFFKMSFSSVGLRMLFLKTSRMRKTNHSFIPRWLTFVRAIFSFFKLGITMFGCFIKRIFASKTLFLNNFHNLIVPQVHN